MAIAKNTAAKADKEVPASKKAVVSKAAAPAKTTPAAKPAAKKEAPAKAAAPKAAAPAKVVKEAAPKIGRKELALAIRAKVTKSGAAVSPKVAEICTIAYEEAIAEALAAGQEVNLPGFGKFVAVHKDAAEKRNPATGDMVLVAAHKQVKFRVGGKFKQAVNGGEEQAEDGEEQAEDGEGEGDE